MSVAISSDPQILLQFTTMVSLRVCPLELKDLDFVDTLLRCFGATKRTKLKDNKTKVGENEVTNLFIVTAGGSKKSLNNGSSLELRQPHF